MVGSGSHTQRFCHSFDSGINPDSASQIKRSARSTISLYVVALASDMSPGAVDFEGTEACDRD